MRHARPLAHLDSAAFTICAHICFSRLAYTLIAGAARAAGCVARDLRLQRSAMSMQGQISEIMLELVGLIAGRRAERMRRSRALMSVVSGRGVHGASLRKYSSPQTTNKTCGVGTAVYNRDSATPPVNKNY